MKLTLVTTASAIASFGVGLGFSGCKRTEAPPPHPPAPTVAAVPADVGGSGAQPAISGGQPPPASAAGR